MIEVFKILHGYYNGIDNISLLPHVNTATRGNKYKLYQSSVKYDLRKHFLLTGVVFYGIVYVILLWILNLDCFESRLDKFWYNQDVLYNWEADFTGTGNQSLGLL